MRLDCRPRDERATTLGDRVWIDGHYFHGPGALEFAKAMTTRDRSTVTMHAFNGIMNNGARCWGCVIRTDTSQAFISHRKLGGCIRGELAVVVPDDDEEQFMAEVFASPKRRREDSE